MRTRGTELDTVVYLNAISVITVDERSMGKKSRDESVILDQGTMAQVEFDAKPSPPSPATPRDKRGLEHDKTQEDYRSRRGSIQGYRLNGACE